MKTLRKIFDNMHCKYQGKDDTGAVISEPDKLWRWITKHFVPKNSNRLEPQVKPACERCKHRHTEEATNGEDLHLCQNPKIRLWNLTNCDIDITEFGCTYFESKSV